MCGFAGWFGREFAREDAARLLSTMCGTIRHRGPDDFGIHVDGPVGFGFRRLSIIDLEGGHQPMASDDGRVWVMLNGEIYNHNALRAGLRERGCRFETSSDTEVLLRLYETEGLAAFQRMNGMFAVAIWDGRQGRLHLVRDRLGVKPLYYARVGDGLVFASEVKAILESGLVTRHVNGRAVWDYLTFRYVPTPETMWEGVMKLPPAHTLTASLDGSAPHVARWWDIPLRTPEPDREQPDAVYEEEFRSLFEDAVGLRMRADVPVGITLSGGLDSSAVVSAARATTETLMTFSVSFAGAPETDELPYARMVARHFATDHHEVTIGAREFMDFLPEFVWHTDEPLADLASVPLYYVSRLASRHVKVVLSGEGSDEILAGYNFEDKARQWDEATAAKAALPGWASGIAGSLAARMCPAFARLRAAAATICDQRLVAEPITMTNYWSSADKRRLFRQADTTWPDSLDRSRARLAALGDRAPLNQALDLYCQDWLVEDLLMKADRMSMANSLELRTPFLDYRLVEWAATLPPRLKAGRSPGGAYRSKEILRRYAESRLPREIIDRPKQGFPVPVYGWLSGELAGWAEETLLSTTSQSRDWFTVDAIRGILRAGVAPSAGMIDRHRLWNALILELWMQRWLT